ncbi:MAG: dipicolinate synthase subunit B [Clostridia bacterium]|nr:dipicolinate synthase subunit B [Clostridia bacterium]
MNLNNLNVGLAITGSFCNFSNIKNLIHDLKKEGANVTAIISETAKDTSTRFYEAEEFYKMLEVETGRDVIDSIVLAEPIGPKDMLDVLLICPCTGNTMAKLNLGIIDTTVLMAAKSILRKNKPVVIGVSSNDAMGANFKNLAELMNTKNIYFVPFGQDDCIKKPKSLVLKYSMVVSTIKEALENKQIQPVLQ